VMKQLQIQQTREKKMSSERMFMEQQQRTLQKQIMMEERAKFRKAMEEHQNHQKKFEKAHVEEYQKGRVEQMRNLTEHKAMRQKQEIDYKEFQVEQRKKFFEAQHKLRSQGSLNNSMDAGMPMRKEDKIKEAKMRNDYHHMMKSNAVLTKLDSIDQHVLWKQNQRQNHLMLKSELNNLKREEHRNHLKKREKTHEYHREINLRKLREKEERLAQMKQYKQTLLDEKKGVQEDNHKQKKAVVELFDKMMRNSNSISPEVILEMFPGEHALIHKLMTLKEVARSSSPMARSAGFDGQQWQSQSLNTSF